MVRLWSNWGWAMVTGAWALLTSYAILQPCPSLLTVNDNYWLRAIYGGFDPIVNSVMRGEEHPSEYNSGLFAVVVLAFLIAIGAVLYVCTRR